VERGRIGPGLHVHRAAGRHRHPARACLGGHAAGPCVGAAAEGSGAAALSPRDAPGHRQVQGGAIGAIDIKTGSEGYPPDLQTLVEGVSVVNDQSGRKLKFLRKVPIDPMTNSTDWGMRSYQDRPDSTSWGGQNVYDVYTKSTGTALDGTKYKDW
jgi:hypothetical protein